MVGRGIAASLFSAVAVAVSAATLWLSELRDADLELILAETLFLTRDDNGSREVLLVPVTLVNGGAREGAVRAVRLAVEGEGLSARYFAQSVGTWPGSEAEPFAPIAVPGRAAVSRNLLFYPERQPSPRIEAGRDLRIRVTALSEGGRAGPIAVETVVRLPYYSLPDLRAGRAIPLRPPLREGPDG